MATTTTTAVQTTTVAPPPGAQPNIQKLTWGEHTNRYVKWLKDNTSECVGRLALKLTGTDADGTWKKIFKLAILAFASILLAPWAAVTHVLKAGYRELCGKKASDLHTVTTPVLTTVTTPTLTVAITTPVQTTLVTSPPVFSVVTDTVTSLVATPPVATVVTTPGLSAVFTVPATT